MKLQGGPELRARLKAIKLAFKPLGRDWADETARLARAAVPVRTGRLQRSIRRKNATQTRATVVSHFTGIFIEKGTKAHDEVPRKGSALIFQAGGQTIFAKKVHKPRTPAKPFAAPAAHEALRRNPMAEQVIREWNNAA